MDGDSIYRSIVEETTTRKNRDSTSCTRAKLHSEYYSKFISYDTHTRILVRQAVEASVDGDHNYLLKNAETKYRKQKLADALWNPSFPSLHVVQHPRPPLRLRQDADDRDR